MLGVGSGEPPGLPPRLLPRLWKKCQRSRRRQRGWHGGTCPAEPRGGLRCLACCRIRPSGSVPPWEIGFCEDALGLNSCWIDRLASRVKLCLCSGSPCSCLVLSKPMPADFHRGSGGHRGVIPIQPLHWLGKRSRPDAALCSGASAGVVVGQGCIWEPTAGMRDWVRFVDPKSC